MTYQISSSSCAAKLSLSIFEVLSLFEIDCFTASLGPKFLFCD